MFSHNQYCFRLKHSTCMALLNLIDKVSNEWDIQQFSIDVSIDLYKVLDAFEYQIVLDQLNDYGIRSMANRKQFLSIGITRVINCGVSQVSIIFLLLCTLYINDIMNVLDLATLIFYADDKTMW